MMRICFDNLLMASQSLQKIQLKSIKRNAGAARKSICNKALVFQTTRETGPFTASLASLALDLVPVAVNIMYNRRYTLRSRLKITATCLGQMKQI